jgi:hypothetical protein
MWLFVGDNEIKFEILLAVVWCLVVGSYYMDVCTVMSCSACYPWKDLQCTANPRRSSKYIVWMSGYPDHHFSYYLASSWYSSRDNPWPSSCGDCYTCTEYFPSESFYCFYSTLDIERTLTSSKWFMRSWLAA